MLAISYFTFMSLRFIFTLTSITFLACYTARQQEDHQQPKPNIIWLVSEDNSKHFLELYDSSGVSLKSLRRLAKNGLVFNNAFSNAPVCSVARSTIISGCYAPRIGTQYHRCIEKVPLPKGLTMFPTYLHKAGYYTTNNSKEDYNLSKDELVWNESSAQASYRKRPPNTPFFHVQNFGITHEGKLHFSSEDIEKKPTRVDPESVKVFPYHPETEISKYTYARLLDHHLILDSLLNAFLDQVEADGLMDDTFIFYYGDHGGVLPRSKGYIYESGLHVPLVVYVPPKYRSLVPKKPGSHINGFVSFVDLAPTVLNLVGIKVPAEMDGRAFLGKGVSASELDGRQTVFGHADRFDEKYDLVRSIRKGSLKYIRNYQPFNRDGLHNFYRYRMLMFEEWRALFKQGRLNAIQAQFFQKKSPEALYNLDVDPHEVNNLADDPTYADQLREMRTLLRDKLKDLPDLSFYPEPYFLEVGRHDPTQFGRERSDEISLLIDVADLNLEEFGDVEERIRENLTAENPWKRYWALIVCSSFGKGAASLTPLAQQLVDHDSVPLVRMRALEFLALSGLSLQPSQFAKVLGLAGSMAEANLMLNSVATLKEMVPGIELPDLTDAVPEQWIKEERSLVPHRLAYLAL